MVKSADFVLITHPLRGSTGNERNRGIKMKNMAQDLGERLKKTIQEEGPKLWAIPEIMRPLVLVAAMLVSEARTGASDRFGDE